MATLVLDRPTAAGFRGHTDTTPSFLIERGIPVPPSQFVRTAIYPFAEMRVGDSFEVSQSQYSNGARSVTQIQTGLSALSRSYAKIHAPNAKFATRKTGDTTVRIWRTV